MMIELIVSGASLGFVAGTFPGTLHTFLVNQTLQHGWRHSIIIPFSPIITDIPIILTMVLILGQLPDSAIAAIQIVGGLYVLWLAYEAWGKVHSEIKLATDANPNQQLQTLGRVMLVNWLNPAPYIFWGTVSTPLLLEGLDQSIFHAAAYLGAFYGVFIALMIGVVIIFDRARTLDPRIVRGMLRISILILIVLGASLIGQGLS